jgi:hypothetical protein
LSEVAPAAVTGEVFLTRVFLIRYTSEDISLKDTGRFKIEIPLEDARDSLAVTISLQYAQINIPVADLIETGAMDTLAFRNLESR